jgi:hypothetical protein
MCLACQITQRMADVEQRRRAGPSEWFWAELAVLRECHRLIDHPYIVAARAGRLSRSDLQLMATEHDHVVVAMGVAAAAVDAGILADEEVWSWRRFACATGWYGGRAWCYGEDPFPETVALARSLAGHGVEAADVVARLHAVRAAQLDVAPTLLLALSEHHAIDGSDARWFRRIPANDRIMALLEDALDGVVAREGPFRLLAAARDSYESLWRYYDRLDASRVLERAA